MDFKRKNIRLQNFDYGQGYAYSVTICTYEKNPLFKNFEIATVIEQEIQFRISKKEVIIYCYCIMPDHIHLLISLSENYSKKLSDWVTAFKRFTTRIIKAKFNIQYLWHINYYDHIIRKEESMQNVSDYILNNPVRKGLVNYWNDYPFSKITV